MGHGPVQAGHTELPEEGSVPVTLGRPRRSERQKRSRQKWKTTLPQSEKLGSLRQLMHVEMKTRSSKKHHRESETSKTETKLTTNTSGEDLSSDSMTESPESVTKTGHQGDTREGGKCYETKQGQERPQQYMTSLVPRKSPPARVLQQFEVLVTPRAGRVRERGRRTPPVGARSVS